MHSKPRLLLPIAAFLIALAALLPSARSGSPQAKARLDAAAKVFPAVRARHDAGVVDVDTVYRWSVRWFEADRAVRGAGAAAQAHQQRMTALETSVAARVQTGMSSREDALAVAYYRAEADVWITDPPR